MISRIRPQFRQYRRIEDYVQFMTITWILEILTISSSFFILRLMTIYRGIGHCLTTMTDIWTFYWFCRYRAFPPHSSSVLHDMTTISKNRSYFSELTMWRYSAFFDYSAFDDTPQLILLWRYRVIQDCYVFPAFVRFYQFSADMPRFRSF